MAPSGLLLDTGTALLGYERRIAELDYAFVHMNDMPDGPPDAETAIALLEQWGYSPGHAPGS